VFIVSHSNTCGQVLIVNYKCVLSAKILEYNDIVCITHCTHTNAFIAQKCNIFTAHSNLSYISLNSKIAARTAILMELNV